MHRTKLLKYIFPFLLIIPVIAHTQENSIKIYANALYFNSEQEPREIDYEPGAINYYGLTFNFRKVNNKRQFHQFETRIDSRKIDKGAYELNRLALHFRYEFGKYLKESADGKFKFQLSGAAKIFLLKEDIRRSQEFANPLTTDNKGLNFTVFGTVEYHITDRIYVEAGTSITGLTILYEKKVIDNPALTARQRSFASLDRGGFSERLLRIGVGYTFKLNKKE
ncbi:MAG: hypothetical protein ACI8P3_001091 [Saprospiraceae bacterium]|jgi:hypothetical protein